MAVSLIHLFIRKVLMHGKVFCRLGRLSIREQFEELGMAKQSIFGNISGYLNQVVVKLCLLELVLMWSEYVTCFFQIQGVGTQANWLAVFLPWEAEKVRGIYVGEAEAEDVLI